MLSIGRYGRLANGMYQIAGVLGIAKKNNLEPVFPKWENHDHRDRFGSNEDIELQKYFEHELPGIPDGVSWNQERGIPWGYHDVRLFQGNWNLSGHFQSPRYFANCMDTVQHFFRMNNEPPLNDYVAIHVRLGDYDHASNLGWHPRLDQRYYGPAMALFPGRKFLVFSDDIPRAKEILGNSIDYSEERDYIQDFKLMKRCSSFIVGNSSYGAMAALLGEDPNKKVVAPRPWFGAAAGITGEDIYDRDWTVINWQ